MIEATPIALPGWVCDFVAEKDLCDKTCPDMGQISDPDGVAVYACSVADIALDEEEPYRTYCPQQCPPTPSNVCEAAEVR